MTEGCRYKTENGFCKVNYFKNVDGMEIHRLCFEECGGIEEDVNKFVVCSHCDTRYPVEKAYLGCYCDRKEKEDPFSFENLYNTKYL